MANKGSKPSDRRAGKRRDRDKRVGTRIPELGYYLIVTDIKETEKNYFEGLRDSIPEKLKDHLVRIHSIGFPGLFLIGIR